MAITTQMRTDVANLYVALFGRAPERDGLGYWVQQLDAGKTVAQVAQEMYNTTPARAFYPEFLTNEEVIGRFYTNVLGRTADDDGLAYWTAKLTAGQSKGSVIGEMITAVTSFAGTGDDALSVAARDSKALFTNKVTVGLYYAVDLGGNDVAKAASVLTGVTKDASTVEAAKADAVSSAGQTYTLTTGTDNIVGTTGNDTIKAVIDTAGKLTTINTLDDINGGAGTDTVQIGTADTGAIALPTLAGVEVVEVKGVQDVQIDTSAVAGVTNLNVVKAGNDGAGLSVSATAAATTDVKVDVTSGAGTIGVVGGNNVTVKLTKAANADDITIGAGTAPKGNVVVETTGAAFAKAAATLADVTVTGGKTVSVTQKATSDASAAAADKSATTNAITQGKITVTANADTTTVTVKQDATAAGKDAADSTGGVTETVSVKFKALAATKTIVLGGLTLTAKVDMTAAEVAAAFANLAAGAAQPDTATGDTQSAGVYTKGTYTGSINGWTTGAANGDTVVFTYKAKTATGGAALTDGGDGAATALTLLTTGKADDATPTGGVLKTTAGTVKIVGGTALKTVSVDGYTAGTTGTDGITGTGNTALDTVNVSNGADFGVESAAATLALKATNVNGKIDVKAGTTTLNAEISNTGTASTALKSASATTVNVTGSGKVSGVNTDLTAATAINTTGFTGAATFTVLGANTTYTGGAGVDSVTVADADTAIAKAIVLGAGNDKLTLSGTGDILVPNVTLDGGEGTDTLVLAAAQAANGKLSANANFAGKLTNFERLEVLTAGANDYTVALDKLGFTNYVITNGVGTTKTLTLDKLGANATIEMASADATSATLEGTIKAVLADATGTADVLNVVTKVGAANAVFGTLEAAGVETIKLNAVDTAPVNTTTGAATIDTATLAVKADKATSLTIEGNSNVTLTLDAATKLLATINAAALTGKLNAAANGEVAMTITGGSGDDTLVASTGATAKADVLVGGAGNDVLEAGSNGATLTGGAGNDIFVLSASSATTGNKEANTYSTVTDFAAGDLLQLGHFDGAAEAVVASFAKLAATLDEGTAVFSNYVAAAMEQAKATTAGTAGDAVWFSFKGNSYVVIDSGTETTGAFTNGEDLIVKLTGVDLAGASFNATFGTIAL